jgi:hypothetical protein
MIDGVSVVCLQVLGLGAYRGRHWSNGAKYQPNTVISRSGKHERCWKANANVIQCNTTVFHPVAISGHEHNIYKEGKNIVYVTSSYVCS